VFLINRWPSSSSNNDIPYYRLHHKMPDYSILRVFGCLCYPNLSATTRHKLAPRSSACVFLGYPPSQKGYRCLDLSNRKIIISRHVIFDETRFPFVASKPQPDSRFFVTGYTPRISIRRSSLAGLCSACPVCCRRFWRPSWAGPCHPVAWHCLSAASGASTGSSYPLGFGISYASRRFGPRHCCCCCCPTAVWSSLHSSSASGTGSSSAARGTFGSRAAGSSVPRPSTEAAVPQSPEPPAWAPRSWTGSLPPPM
jgi:hypothetical protein